MRKWTARLGGSVGAVAWLVGLPMVGLAGVIPSGAEYYLVGLMGAILGCAIVPFALSIPALRERNRRNDAVHMSGAAIGVLLAIPSVLLALGAQGDFGNTPPAWILDVATAALVGLFVWVLATTFAARRDIGRVAFWLGILTAGSFAVTLITPAFIPVVTNATVDLVFVITLAMWAGLPMWLVSVAWRQAPTLSS